MREAALNHGCTYRDAVRPRDAGQQLAAFYAARYTHSSLDTWRERIRAGEITRNGTAACDPAALVRTGDELLWTRAPWQEAAVPDDWRIVRETSEWIAIDKPSGLPMQPAGGFLEHTLLEMLRAHLTARDGACEFLAPCHRLGRGTSGLALFAKTRAAAQRLGALFRDETERAAGALEKIYLARATPWRDAAIGATIEFTTPIGRVPHPILGTIHAADSEHGKPARSVGTVVETTPEYTLWRVHLITGRPHQIRIHLAAFGTPLVGDPLFTVGGHPRADALPGDGGYDLRAIRLAFEDNGERVVIEA